MCVLILFHLCVLIWYQRCWSEASAGERANSAMLSDTSSPLHWQSGFCMFQKHAPASPVEVVYYAFFFFFSEHGVDSWQRLKAQQVPQKDAGAFQRPHTLSDHLRRSLRFSPRGSIIDLRIQRVSETLRGPQSLRESRGVSETLRESHSVSGSPRGSASRRESQRVSESFREPRRVSTSLMESQRVSGNPRESQSVSESLRESQRAPESRRVSESLRESHRV